MCTHARHLPAWKGWCSARAAGLALAIVASGGPEADAALEVTAVVIDGHEEQIPARPAGGVPAAVRVASNARTLAFRFREIRDSNVMGGDARLRYRLDGVDADWRDEPAHGRLSLIFLDDAGSTVGSSDAKMHGTSEEREKGTQLISTPRV